MGGCDSGGRMEGIYHGRGYLVGDSNVGVCMPERCMSASLPTRASLSHVGTVCLPSFLSPGCSTIGKYLYKGLTFCVCWSRVLSLLATYEPTFISLTSGNPVDVVRQLLYRVPSRILVYLAPRRTDLRLVSVHTVQVLPGVITVHAVWD